VLIYFYKYHLMYKNISLSIKNREEYITLMKSEYDMKALQYEPKKFPIDYSLDFEAMNSFFKNKRVAIVGPSKSLKGQKLGKTIDNYDIVCHLNRLPLINNTEDYGSRGDVLINYCVPAQNNKQFIKSISSFFIHIKCLYV